MVCSYQRPYLQLTVELDQTQYTGFLIMRLCLEYTVERDSSNPRGSSYLCKSKHCSARQPPLVPLHSPPLFFSSHVTPLTCALWQRSERTPCSGCHGNDLGGPQSDIVVHRRARSHTAAKASDRYSITRKRGWGWVGRRELHCSELTAEAQGKLVREVSVFVSQWQQMCVCD